MGYPLEGYFCPRGAKQHYDGAGNSCFSESAQEDINNPDAHGQVLRSGQLKVRMRGVRAVQSADGSW